MAPSLNRLRTSSGQISIYLAFMLVPMFLFFFVMLNVGQLVFERMHLQVAADAGALAGASVQALGLNEIADVNAQLQALFWRTQALVSPPRIWCPPHEWPEWPGQPIAHQRAEFQWQHDYVVQGVSPIAASKAREVADRTVVLNLPGARPAIEFGSQQTALASFEIVPGRLEWLYWNPGCPPCPGGLGCAGVSWAGTQVNAWLTKTSVTTFSLGVIQEPKPVLTAPGLFEALAGTVMQIPVMQAVAAAKPEGGFVLAGNPEYRARLILASDATLPPSITSPERLRH